MKKTLSLVLSALILILALLPAFPMDAKAADSSDYYWPVPGFYRLSGAYTGNGDNDHRGIDISSSGIADATVYAAKSGTVYKSYNGCPHVHTSGYAVDCKCWCNFSMGNFVWIQHDDGTGARYMHLKKDSGIPAEGTRVEQGDPIGKVGSSGYSSGYHLHFEILENYRDNRSQINTNPTDSRHSGATGKACMSYCYDLIAIDRYPSAVVVEITNKEGTKIYDRPCSEQTDEKAEVIGYLDKGENVILTRIASDPVLLVDVLFLVCCFRDGASTVTDDDFAESIVGDVIDDASLALLTGIAEFFPTSRRLPMLKAVEMTRAAMKEYRESMTATLTGESSE